MAKQIFKLENVNQKHTTFALPKNVRGMIDLLDTKQKKQTESMQALQALFAFADGETVDISVYSPVVQAFLITCFSVMQEYETRFDERCRKNKQIAEHRWEEQRKNQNNQSKDSGKPEEKNENRRNNSNTGSDNEEYPPLPFDY